MKNVVVQTGKYGWYILKNATHEDIDTFASFLLNDRDGFFRYFRNPQQVLSQNVYCGNLYQVIKYDASIYLSTIFDDFDRDDNGRALPTGVSYEFTASLEEFLKALEEWDKIDALKPRHKEVLIQQDDEGKISFQISS